MPRLLASLFVILCLAGCSRVGEGVSPPSGGYTVAQHEHRLAARNLTALVERSVPGRNLYQLADQLKLRPPRPIARVLRHTSPNYPVGHRDNFWVLSEDQLTFFVMHATIRAETPHLYIYVQNGVKVAQAAVRKAALHFERHTYPTDRALFGSEWRPGVDGDPHITCLIGDLHSSGAAGFFSAEDEYPPLVYSHSNAREMFYINTNTLPGQGQFDVTLAHEFQHMIHWHTHPRDNAWLNEGMSMLAQRVNGYPDSVSAEVESFLADPGTQLNTWSANGDNANHYGAAYLFLAYVYDRFGRSVIRDLLTDRNYTDFELVNDVLRKHHIKERADQLVGDWMVANYIDDAAVAHGIYAYRDLPGNTQKVPGSSISKSPPFTYQSALAPYASSYVELPDLTGTKPFHLRFSAPTTVPVVGLPSGSTGPYWWSNRGDLIDTRLVRTVNLSHVHRAHLHYRIWYNIENTYDYGFVEASVDGGRTWTTLPATDTRTANPTGANYGNGYTGNSNGWLSETVNLSRYAGHQYSGGVRLRFEYITDDETNLQGMAVKDITIPEIGYRDNIQGGAGGWSSQGFLPIARNALPSHWHVRLIEYTTGGIKVQSFPLGTDETGSLLVDPGAGHLQKLVVAVFNSAPKTTVKTTFQLSASSS